MGDTSGPASSGLGLGSQERSYPFRRIFYGWWIVLTSAVGLFWGVPITVYSFSVFLRPVMQEFHVGRAAVSLGFTVQLFVSALCTPWTGWLLDRFGARKVILPFTALFGAVLISNRVFSASLGRFYFFYAALGFFVHTVWVCSLPVVRPAPRPRPWANDARNWRGSDHHALAYAAAHYKVRLAHSVHDTR